MNSINTENAGTTSFVKQPRICILLQQNTDYSRSTACLDQVANISKNDLSSFAMTLSPCMKTRRICAHGTH